jgi:hypothetical protein
VFYYFGRKGDLAKTYPEPLYDLVIEPFAGSMAYTLFHRPKMALGIEANERVVDLWWRLRDMSMREIRAMPVPEIGERTDDLYWVLASASNTSLEVRGRTVTWFMDMRLERQKRLTIKHHAYVRGHVLYQHGDYTDAPDIEATWFIDPPYEGVTGYGNEPLDYAALAEWVLSRRGQVIVCEGAQGSWLPFQDHHVLRGVNSGQGGTAHREQAWTASIQVCRCGARFKPTRANHVHCSTRCRVAAHRAS